MLWPQLTDEQKKWLDVLRLKGSEKKRQEESDAPANLLRRCNCVTELLYQYLLLGSC